MFCQLESLRKCKNIKSVNEVLQSLPKTLDEMYERILSSIDEANIHTARRALQWLILAKRPLSAEELAEAAVLDPGPNQDLKAFISERLFNPEDGLLEILGPLVKLCPNVFIEGHLKSAFALAHFSVQEYLTSGRLTRPEVNLFSVDYNSGKEITEACLKYILRLDLIGLGRLRVEASKNKTLEYTLEDLEAMPLEPLANSLRADNVQLQRPKHMHPNPYGPHGYKSWYRDCSKTEASFPLLKYAVTFCWEHFENYESALKTMGLADATESSILKHFFSLSMEQTIYWLEQIYYLDEYEEISTGTSETFLGPGLFCGPLNPKNMRTDFA